MTTKQAAASIGFTRCAVCKIDLKGRFVYLDEKIEALLGFSKEELFGKSFLEFLDEPSQQLIEELLSHRNHYETFYDTTVISVYNRSRTLTRMRAVVSLNFIAGNPVNYQLIINSEGPAAETADDRRANDYRSLVQELVRIDSPCDWQQLLVLLCRFVGARQACAYLVTDDGLQPRSAVTRQATGEFTFNGVSPAGNLHESVATTGKEYSFIDQQAVQDVVEQCGSAPNEFVTCLTVTENDRYLVRLIFDEDFDHAQAQASIGDARLVLELFAGLLRPGNNEGGGGFDIKFTVGFLDSLGVAALLTNAEGSVIGYNPSTLKLVKEENLEGNYLDVLNAFSEFNPSSVIDRTIDYLNASAGEEDYSDDLTLGLKVSTGGRVRLTVMKLSDDPGDISGCFVFIPEGAVSDESSAYQCDMQVWKAAFRLLRQELKTTADVADQLGHEFYNELGAGGNAGIEKINAGIRTLRWGVDEMIRFARLVKADEPVRTTDLSLLTDEQIQQLSDENSRRDLKCEYESLPKIRTKPGLLGYALRCILSNSFKYNDRPNREIKVAAEIRDGLCEIIVSDNGFGIAAKSLPRVFDALYRAPDKKVKAIEGHGLGLTLCREIVRILGGDVSIVSTVGEGTQVTVTLPAE